MEFVFFPSIFVNPIYKICLYSFYTKINNFASQKYDDFNELFRCHLSFSFLLHHTFFSSFFFNLLYS